MMLNMISKCNNKFIGIRVVNIKKREESKNNKIHLINRMSILNRVVFIK